MEGNLKMPESQYLAAEFLQAAATPPQKKITIWTHCPKCMVRTEHVLKEIRQGNGETEVYACEGCGSRMEYRVT